MPEHPNAALIRRGYEAFSRGDLESLVPLFDEDAVWHVPEGTPFSGDHEGREAVLAMLRGLIEQTDGTFVAEVSDVSAHGQHAVAITRLRGTFDGKEMEAAGAAVYHISEGRIREVWSLRPEVRTGHELASAAAAAARARAVRSR